jgi:hypothetical protein
MLRGFAGLPFAMLAIWSSMHLMKIILLLAAIAHALEA